MNSNVTVKVLSTLLLVGLFCWAPTSLAGETQVVHSRLWGKDGQAWSDESRLTDFSYAGYHRGERPVPLRKPDVSVKDFGAEGDGTTDDTAAFQRAISSAGNVATIGRGVDLCFDHHRRGPRANLFTAIDLGEGSRMFQSGGGAKLGRHSGAWETFWGIQSKRPQKWPEGWGPVLMNIVGVRSTETAVTEETGQWFEPVDPLQLDPINLYLAQLKRRLGVRG